MSDTLRDHIEAWGGESVVISYDSPTGTWMFIALHDTRHGPATGGTRMKTYPAIEDGLVDALRLGEGMTYKWAGVGMPFGGGKAVLATPGPLDDDARNGLLDRYGELLVSLRGSFRTGVDMGTNPEDLARVDRGVGTVMGIVDGHSQDPGPYTALGVFVGIQAALSQKLGSPSLTGRSVLVEGVGDVGRPLAEMLSEAGAAVILADIDPGAAKALARRIGAEVVAPADSHETPVDVYAPCAVGATLNPDTVPRLRCGVVAGSANNQLLTPADADALHERGILYAPDYIINAGGAIAFGHMAGGMDARSELEAEVRKIGPTLTGIFVEAAVAGQSPFHAAKRLAERFLDTERGPRE
jgi:leucine dehydrogenase